MPTYEYTCSNCGLVFELFVKMKYADDPDMTQCPECACKETKRSIGCAGFSLKGTCWERDGYSYYVGDAVKNGGIHRED